MHWLEIAAHGGQLAITKPRSTELLELGIICVSGLGIGFLFLRALEEGSWLAAGLSAGVVLLGLYLSGLRRHRVYLFDKDTHAFSRDGRVLCPTDQIDHVQLEEWCFDGSVSFTVEVVCKNQHEFEIGECPHFHDALEVAQRIASHLDTRVEITRC